jgi:hypothetical protein
VTGHTLQWEKGGTLVSKQSLPFPSAPSSCHADTRTTNLPFPEEGTTYKKELGDIYQLQPERDEMRVKEHPAAGKISKNDPI